MNRVSHIALTALALSIATPGGLSTALADHGAAQHGSAAAAAAPSAIPWYARQQAELPPLFDDLGTVTLPVTTSNPQAQLYVDQGIRLAYAFNHEEALRAFRAAQRLDPTCAMAFWGEAFVLGPNINVPMDPGSIGFAIAALDKAQALADGASERERMLISALARRYSPDPAADRGALNEAYAEAMAEVAARFPDDHEVAVLLADAIMNISPWDYWQAGGHDPKGRTPEALAALEGVLAENPDHPGAIHYYIHLVEASDNPERAEPYAERLAAQMPGAGHIVHMPSHIYYRLGRYLDSLASNIDAVAVDEAYLATADANGVYPMMYYPHNIHFVLVSAQMTGDLDVALDAADKLAVTVTDDAARAVPPAQPIKAAPLFAYAEFGDPAAVLELPAPPDDLPYVKAMWHYARGIARLRGGDAAAARAEAEAIAELSLTSNFAGLIAGGVPAADVLTLAQHVVTGRAARTEGDLKSAIDAFTVAAEVQDALPYMEPPYWYYPVRQSLGAALLDAGRLEEAEEQFRQSLERSPDSAWALFGLMTVQTARGDTVGAAETKARLEEVWNGDAAAMDLSRL